MTTEGSAVVAAFAAFVALAALLGCLLVLGLVWKLYTEFTKERMSSLRSTEPGTSSEGGEHGAGA